jgi:hypothetical protein
MPSSLAYQPLKANRLISVTDAVPVVPRTTMDAAASARLFDLFRLWWGEAGCEQDSRREPRKQESTEIKRTFDRRTGKVNGSLPVLLVLVRRWRITENARFSPRISHIVYMRKRSRILRMGLILAVPSALLITFLYFRCFDSPAGWYWDPNIGCEGDAYWVLGDGMISLHTPDSYDKEGHYSKVGDKWVSDGTVPDTFKPGIFGIRVISPGNGTDEYLFRRSFSWIPKSWEWIESVTRGN